MAAANDMPMNPRQLPPWSGPSFVPVQASLGPVEKPSQFPFQDATSENPNLYPPVCIRSHWDPGMILRRTLPQQQVATPLDPRPWTKVCLRYTTSQDFEDAPRPSDSVVFPSGGTVYPPSRYREAIDHESELRRLDRPLGTCERDQYIPPTTGDMYIPNVTVPDRRQPNSRFVQELSFPMAAMRDEKPYDCVFDAQMAAFSRSQMPFNNATKQSRYAVTRKDLVKQQIPQPIPSSKVSLS
jgi:hypothetical protein